MNFFVVLILSLFIAVESSTATEDEGFHNKNEMNENAGLSVANDTKQESQLTRPRRFVGAVYRRKSPCYRHFFVGKKPPTGFKSSTGNANNLRYICQQYGVVMCFSTMFDLNYGIPIYSAYVVTRAQARKIGSASRYSLKFSQEPGILQNQQGSTYMYQGTGTGYTGIHKGHLVPAETYSFSTSHIRSTFTYTNAVPQYRTFNVGQWARYERKIREYAKNVCSSRNEGDLYLLTGISGIRIYSAFKKTFGCGKEKRMSRYQHIVIPNSMWTAGCCVRGQTVFGSFAVIGNNDPDKTKINMVQLSVYELEGMIGNVNLFPGNYDCSNNKYDVTI